MKINRQEYLDKVKACFIGKNIGGTFGGPYEGVREVLNVTDFVTNKGEPLPNDDLDLQLVWLHALEVEGPTHIDSDTLGQYWKSFITPYWNEYGITKINMSKSIKPSVSGDMPNNVWKHSNGAWIRTEIWASLFPAAVDDAVRYAIEDAVVDHGTGEGTYAAAYVAALESAAFAISDLKEIISIGLSKIPESSRVSQTVKFVLNEYEKGTDWLDVRNKVMELNKDIGDGWFQAPNNIAFVTIGLLYGENDFKKSMILAVNCGDDTDCTAATVGSIFGLLYGIKGIPSDWNEYVGDKIVTCSINQGVRFKAPKTIDELVDRINKQVDICLLTNRTFITLGNENEITNEELESLKQPFGVYKNYEEKDHIRATKESLVENTFKVRLGTITPVVTYENPCFVPESESTISLKIVNNVKSHGNQPYLVKVKVYSDKGVMPNKRAFEMFVPDSTSLTKEVCSSSKAIKIRFGNIEDTSAKIILEFSTNERGILGYIPVAFIKL